MGANRAVQDAVAMGDAAVFFSVRFSFLKVAGYLRNPSFRWNGMDSGASATQIGQHFDRTYVVGSSAVAVAVAAAVSSFVHDVVAAAVGTMVERHPLARTANAEAV